VTLCIGAALSVSDAVAQPQGISLANRPEVERPVPGQGGDAVLPAGFQEIRWGASVEILQVTHGPLERRPSPKTDLELLIEAPAPGEPSRNIVHYTLWRDQLLELRLYYQERLVGGEALDFVARVEEAYGAGEHSVTRGVNTPSGRPGAVIEERWVWEDPFTTQILLRDPETNEWSMVRRSRVLSEYQKASEEREADQSRDDRIKSLPID